MTRRSYNFNKETLLLIVMEDLYFEIKAIYKAFIKILLFDEMRKYNKLTSHL